MSKLTILVAVAALGIGGYAAYGQCEMESRMDGIEQGVRDTQASIDDIKLQLTDALANRGHAPELLSADRGALVPVADDNGSDAAGLATRQPASAMERLAALERKVASQNDTLASMKDAAESAPKKLSQIANRFMASNFIHNMDSAEKTLELTERQKADMQDLIDDGKREIEDLHDTRNDDGETWKEVGKAKMTKMGGGDGGFSFAMPNFRKIHKFKNTKVPGSNETFGEADKRIRENTFGQVRNLLNPKQAKTWDKSRKSSLLGRGGGETSIAFSTIEIRGSDDK